MKKILFLLFAIFAFFSCSNEEVMTEMPLAKGLNIQNDYVLLNDGSTNNAGTLQFTADVPEVTVKWVGYPEFNLDTTQTKVTLSNGKGVLPVKWMKKQENGKYAPENSYFTGGVIITAGTQKKYVPIVWNEVAKFGETPLNLRTRVVGADGIDPQAAFIQFIPPTPAMQADRGAQIAARLLGVDYVLVDYSNIKAIHNINMDETLLPTEITNPTGITMFKFNWKDQALVASTPAFSTIISFFCFDYGSPAQLVLKWEPNGGGTNPPTEDLQYSTSNLPTGNIPATGGSYTFTFTGTYTGNLQVRALVDGVAQAPGATVTNKQPQCTIPANTGTATRSIQFQYKTATGEWTSLPAETNRTQSGSGTGGAGVTAGSIVPAGDVPDEGGTFYCNFTGTYTGSIIYRATKDGTEVIRTTGNAPSLLSIKVPGITGQKQATIRFEYSTDNGVTWTLIESRTQILETLSVNAIQPAGNIPAQGGTYTCSIYGTYSKNITVHARVGATVLANVSGKAPANLSIAIPANNTTATRLIVFEYSKNGGPWTTMEVKRQNGN